ncbi:MAG TPA: C4-type zinc ribbon domain-containing protein [Armatimonadota bacterium]|nr:C4-type zinc ribbon domain-containing protein [Armatimonadota bacterium]
MSADLKALYDLQTVDLELAKAQKARAALDGGTAKKRQVEAVRQQADAANELLHEATAEMQDKDLNLKSVETKQKAFKDKLYGGTVTSPKELESMEKEIEMLGRQKDKLEERILELLDIIEERKSAIASAQATLKQQEDELAAIMEKRRRDEASLLARIKELSAQREKALPAVEPALLKRYEALRPRARGVVVSKVEADSCSTCHVQITSGRLREIRSSAEKETCENCGRMLYLEVK